MGTSTLGECVSARCVCNIYDNNISPGLLIIIIKIIILYFIQIRHTDDFPPTGTPASIYNFEGRLRKNINDFTMRIGSSSNVLIATLRENSFILAGPLRQKWITSDTIHVNPERSFGGTNGEPPSEASQLLKGGTGVLPLKMSKTYIANGAIYVIPELYL